MGIELLIDTLRHAGEVRLRAQGLSMVPALWPGEVLVVARKGFPDVTVGEIAVFRCHGGIAAHRVLKTQGTGLDTIVTRGDAMTVDDAPVSADEFLGVVVEVERGGRRVVPSAYRTPAARMASAVFARSAHVSRWAQKIMANGH
ncbi:MAG: S24/S26 family peptidase [Bryobacteraceae bacterium]